MDFSLIAGLVALGGCTGFLAGLLGIGGGMIIVPLLTFIFSRLGFPTDHLVHIAVATATGTILFTSISSAREHHRHGAVRWRTVAGMAPGIVAGSLLGPQVVGVMSTSALAAFFALFVTLSATQMLLDRKPKPSREMPKTAGLFGVGGGIGLISSMVGAGGGFISVPFQVWCNVPLRNAVATSAALGLPIAAAGTVGFIVAGLRESGLPQYSLGFIYLPALFSIVVGSVLSAPVGARAAHRWPVKTLKRIFACVLYLLAGYMLWKAMQ